MRIGQRSRNMDRRGRTLERCGLYGRWRANRTGTPRDALRLLRRTPGFTAAAVLMLALGIGVNTAVLSIVNGVVLNPLPYPRPNQLVAVYSRTADEPRASSSYPNFLEAGRGESLASAARCRTTQGDNFPTSSTFIDFTPRESPDRIRHLHHDLAAPPASLSAAPPRTALPARSDVTVSVPPMLRAPPQRAHSAEH